MLCHVMTYRPVSAYAMVGLCRFTRPSIFCFTQDWIVRHKFVPSRHTQECPVDRSATSRKAPLCDIDTRDHQPE